jgi:hypothetical protein
VNEKELVKKPRGGGVSVLEVFNICNLLEVERLVFFSSKAVNFSLFEEG